VANGASPITILRLASRHRSKITGPLVDFAVEDDPEGTIYWKIAHGIRFTGMLAFRPTLADRDLWQLTLFLKRMDNLPPGIRQAWGAARGGR
jgi:hypothetical protein